MKTAPNYLIADSLLYAFLNAVQKLAPFIFLPIVIRFLGQESLKIYDVAFAYASLFSWLIILGQDAAASVLYFDEKKTNFNKREVTTYAFFIQLASLLVWSTLLFCFSERWGNLLFSGSAEFTAWWRVALIVLPGQILLNYGLNLLLWRRRRSAYATLCVLQSAVSIVSVYLSLVFFKNGLGELFYCIIGSTALAAVVGCIMVRKQLTAPLFPLNKALLKSLLVLGLPFALTAFFTQLLPSIDRYFLLRYHYANELAPYVLAVKIGSLVSFGTSAFVLAFTPYSLAKLNEATAEKELSALFRFVSAAAFVVVPFALLFRNLLIEIFAGAGFGPAAKLLPFFFFGWVFDMLAYFPLLGIYRSHKSWLSLVLFASGFLLISVFNLVLVPALGLYGAALSFCLCKAAVFFLSWQMLKRHFPLRIHAVSFVGSLAASVLVSYLLFVWPMPVAVLYSGLVLTGIFVYLKKEGKIKAGFHQVKEAMGLRSRQ